MTKLSEMLPSGAAERIYNAATDAMKDAADARPHIAAASAFAVAVLKELLPLIQAQDKRLAQLEDHITRPEINE